MRIGTWNLECGGRTAAALAGQIERRRRIVADAMVYTEPGLDLSASGAGCVSSPAKRPIRGGRAAWVSICGPSVEPVGTPLPFVIAPRAVAMWTLAVLVVSFVASAIPAWLATRTTVRDALDGA